MSKQEILDLLNEVLKVYEEVWDPSPEMQTVMDRIETAIYKLGGSLTTQ